MRRFFRTNPIGWGIAFAVIVVIAVFFTFHPSVPFVHHYTVRAVFRSSNNIKPNSPVRVAGVDVGKVTAVEHEHAGKAPTVVTMQIDKDGLPLHSDATFKVRPRIFLEGNFFMDVRPGSPSAPTVDDGHTFPINQTAAPVQLDQVLKALPHDTRNELKRALGEYSKGLSHGGAEGFNRSIPYWEPAYKNGAVVSNATLGTRPHDLSGYIRSAGPVAEAIDRNPQALKSLVTDFDTTAAAFARESDRLKAAISALPDTLGAALPALAALNDAFPPVRHLIDVLRPAVRTSLPALKAGIPLVTQLRGLVSREEARGLVNDLRPLVPQLTQLNKVSVPLNEQVRLASQCQLNVILPWSQKKVPDPNFPAKVPVYEEATRFLPGISSESRSGDANGQWFRVLATPGNYTYSLGNGTFTTTNIPLTGVNPPPVFQRPPLKPDVPCETQTPPTLETNPAQPPKQVDTTMSAAAKARAAVGKNIAITWLRNSIEQAGLNLKVTAEEATKATIEKIGEIARKTFGG